MFILKTMNSFSWESLTKWQILKTNALALVLVDESPVRQSRNIWKIRWNSDWICTNGLEKHDDVELKYVCVIWSAGCSIFLPQSPEEVVVSIIIVKNERSIILERKS